MLEVLTGTGLAAAAGLNAGLPLLLLGAAARWTDLVQLPVGWTWLAEGWVLALLALLVLLDVVADKVPGLDHLNDLVQTVVRPAAGGLAFGAGSGAQTVTVSDPAAFGEVSTWVPVVLGVLVALGVHTGKAAARPVVNASTAGVGGPLVSVLEDVAGVALTVLAILVPAVVLVVLALAAWAGVRLVRRRRRRARGRRAAGRRVAAGAEEGR